MEDIEGKLYYYKAFIQRVIDGDTVVAIIDLGLRISVCQRLRLARINAPELAAPMGETFKSVLAEKIEGKTVFIKSKRLDKYGRSLAEIWLNGENINDAIASIFPT